MKYVYKYMLLILSGVMTLKHNILCSQILFRFSAIICPLKPLKTSLSVLPFSEAGTILSYDTQLIFLKWREKETNCDEGEPRQGYRLSSLSCILPKLLVKGINIHIPVFFSWFSGMSRVLGVNKDRKPRYAVSFTAHKTLEIFLEDR